MSYCNNNCKICSRFIISTSVTVVAVGGVDTLVIDVPTGTYGNQCRYCLVVAQAIPTAATVAMPVAISIGGDTTTVYPLVRCDCSQVTACGISSRTKYPLVVATNATGGVFKVLRNLPRCPVDALASLPAPAAATAAAVAEPAAFVEPVAASTFSLDAPGSVSRTITTTTKEVLNRE